MQESKECYVTGSQSNLHRHHVYGGSNRSNSEKYGCWIWLRADYHNMSDHGVHFDKELDLAIKQQTQVRFKAIWGRDRFMEVFGRNYL